MPKGPVDRTYASGSGAGGGRGYYGSRSVGRGSTARSTTRVAPRRRTDKLVNQLIQARYNATPRDQWPRIEVPRARVVSSRKAERMASKAEKKRTEARQYAEDMRVWGSSRKAVNPRLPANIAKTAMKGAAAGAAAAVVVKKTSGGKSPGRVRAMEAKRYEERKSSMRRTGKGK